MVDVIGQGDLSLCKGREHLCVKVAQLRLDVVKQDGKRLAAKMNYLKDKGGVGGARGGGGEGDAQGCFQAYSRYHSSVSYVMCVYSNRAWQLFATSLQQSWYKLSAVVSVHHSVLCCPQRYATVISTQGMGLNTHE